MDNNGLHHDGGLDDSGLENSDHDEDDLEDGDHDVSRCSTAPRIG